MPPQSRPGPPSHPGAPRPIPEVHPGAPRPTSDTHPGAPRPVPSAQTKPPDLPLGRGVASMISALLLIIDLSHVIVLFSTAGPPPSGPPPAEPPAARPQAAAQSQLPPPIQPTLPAPLQPQQAAAPAASAGPSQGLASPKPPPRSRSSHALPPDAAKPETAPAAQVGSSFFSSFLNKQNLIPQIRPVIIIVMGMFSSHLCCNETSKVAVTLL